MTKDEGNAADGRFSAACWSVRKEKSMKANSGNYGSVLHCSFCGKSQDEVRKLIAGPTVYICDECIELCNEIIAEETEERFVPGRMTVPKPMEIKAKLDEYVIGQEYAKKIL